MGNGPKYMDRHVREWLERAEEGKLALPSFQRSYVWKKNQSIADYLQAVFENRPTGVFLVLETNGVPQFPSRSLKGVDADGVQVEELLLDGQQRLTSLWHAFEGSGNATYYLEASSLSQYDVSVRKVRFWPKASAEGRQRNDPRDAYNMNLVPLHILRDKPTSQAGLRQIWEWSSAALQDRDEARKLEQAIKDQGKKLLDRNLHYCVLAADTEKKKAIDIFIQSNKSSVKVNEFDIAVALAENKAEERLRKRLADFNRQSDVVRHYSDAKDGDEETRITQIGERLLFSVCMAVNNFAPKKGRFYEVIEDLFESGWDHGHQKLAELLQNYEKALNSLSQRGVATGDLLPSLPALHVLTALQEDLNKLNRAKEMGIANSLISAYLWRSFFTDRYKSQANDRLFEDYKELKNCIDEIKTTGALGSPEKVPIFRNNQHSLPTAARLGDLEDPIVPWIKGKKRIGQAVAAVSLNENPLDWATGDKLDAIKLRKLKAQGKLHRHHIFPKKVLRDAGIGETEIFHGLNGAVLLKPTNREFDRNPPADYLQGIRKNQPGVSDAALRKRVESHLVPYDLLKMDGDVKATYPKFIKHRAKIIADKIAELAKWPGGQG